MNRKQRTIFTLVLFWSAVTSVPGFLLWREDQQQRLDHQLLAAIMREDTPSALRALKLGANANAADEEQDISAWQRIWNILRGGWTKPVPADTPLLLSMQLSMYHHEDDPGLIQALLAHGARVNVVDELGGSALYYALSGEKPTCAKLLIKHGAIVDGRTADEALYTAIDSCDDTDILELILQRDANPNRVDPTRRTPLGQAVYRGNPDIVRCLLRYHANPNMSSARYMGPLEYAEKEDMTEIAKMLIDAGAKQ